MKVLKIENKKCFYTINGIDYNPITDISKDDIYSILDIICNTDDYKFDEYNDDVEIVNDVEKIIYSNLYMQITSFVEKKDTLISEVNDELKSVKEKYEIAKENE